MQELSRYMLGENYTLETKFQPHAKFEYVCQSRGFAKFKLIKINQVIKLSSGVGYVIARNNPEKNQV